MVSVIAKLFIAIFIGFMFAVLIRSTRPQFWKLNKWRTLGLYFGMIALAIQPSTWLFNAMVHKHQKELMTSNHQWQTAFEAETHACAKAGLKDPAWSNYRFTCTDDRGFVHEIRPPKCNKEFLRNNSPIRSGEICNE